MFFGMCNPSQKKASSLRLTAVALASVLLCIALFFLIPSQFAYAEETEIDGVKYTYEVNDDGSVKITGLSSSSKTSVVVPGVIADNEVKEISLGAISGPGSAPSAAPNIGKITSLDLTKCAQLEKFTSYDLGFTSINAANCSKLIELECEYNKLTSLNVSGCTALETLWCGSNELISLDVSTCTNWRNLIVPITRLAH